MENVSIFAALIAGIFSFISPCVLPLVPAYLSFISGVSIGDLKSGEDRWKNTKSVLLSSIVFVLGFSVVFVALGASATTLGQFLLEKFTLFTKIAGVIIIILGLHFIGVFRIKWLNMEKRFYMQTKNVGLMSAFVIGFAFAFGWTPCIGPILATILFLAAQQESVNQGIFLLALYSMGLGIPFIVTGLVFNTFIGIFAWIKRNFRKIEIVSGLFLIFVGVLIIFDYFSFISSYFSRWFPFLTTVG